MGDVLRIAIGPTLSLLFFFIGYRRTVGARKERARAAELEIERLMVRRVIVDAYTPAWDDLTRMLARKARQQRVKVSDLASESQLLTAIYTEILENEFVAHSDRETFLRRVDEVIRQEPLKSTTEDREVAVESAILSADRIAIARQRQRLLLAMGALAATAGTGAATLSTVGASGISAYELLPVVAAASAIFVGLAGLVVRQRERLDEDASPVATSDVAFERAVVDAVLRAGFRPVEDSQSAVDFRLDTQAGQIGIVVSYLTDATTDRVRTLVRRALGEVGPLQRLDELVLVLPTVPAALRQWSADGVRLLDLRGLRNYLEALNKTPPSQTNGTVDTREGATS